MEISFSELRADKDVFLHLWISRFCLEHGEPFCQQVLSQFLASDLFKDITESIYWSGWGSVQLGRRNWQECKTDKTEEMRQGERKHLEPLAGVLLGSSPEVAPY